MNNRKPLSKKEKTIIIAGVVLGSLLLLSSLIMIFLALSWNFDVEFHETAFTITMFSGVLILLAAFLYWVGLSVARSDKVKRMKDDIKSNPDEARDFLLSFTIMENTFTVVLVFFSIFIASAVVCELSRSSEVFSEMINEIHGRRFYSDGYLKIWQNLKGAPLTFLLLTLLPPGLLTLPFEWYKNRKIKEIGERGRLKKSLAHTEIKNPDDEQKTDGSLFRETEDRPRRFCPECGEKIEEGAKFCTVCGKKII